jgi:gliding motility-associated-like protein
VAGKGKIENEIPNGGEVNYTADFLPNGDFETVQVSNVETSEKGCIGPQNKKDITIESLPKPEILTEDGPIRWNGLVQVFQAKGRQGSRFEWEAENGELTSNQGLATASISWFADRLTYSLQVKEITRLGCEGLSEKRIPEVDKTVFIPNLLTPNGDGKNDVLKIENLQFYPENELEIFDRWGKRIYHSRPYNQNWPVEKMRSGLYYISISTGSVVGRGWLWISE